MERGLFAFGFDFDVTSLFGSSNSVWPITTPEIVHFAVPYRSWYVFITSLLGLYQILWNKAQGVSWYSACVVPRIRVKYVDILISDFRRDLNIEYVLLGISPPSNCSWPTFRNPVSVPSSKAGGRLPSAFENGTDTGFRNVGQLQFDAGEIPKRTFSTGK
jgi:hypothetical protein